MAHRTRTHSGSDSRADKQLPVYQVGTNTPPTPVSAAVQGEIAVDKSGSIEISGQASTPIGAIALVSIVALVAIVLVVGLFVWLLRSEGIYENEDARAREPSSRDVSTPVNDRPRGVEHETRDRPVVHEGDAEDGAGYRDHCDQVDADQAG